MNVEDKIMSLKTLLSQLEQWRKKGEKIVFTNGCFDILHTGHITLINHCATIGDKVIIGLNTDKSVQKLKGQNRPVNNENDRALLLASLQNIDAVVLFEEETPLNLIKAISPDVLVKGGDYKKDEIVGADDVLAAGGNVEIVSLVVGKSTTALIKQLNNLT